MINVVQTSICKLVLFVMIMMYLYTCRIRTSICLKLLWEIPNNHCCICIIITIIFYSHVQYLAILKLLFTVMSLGWLHCEIAHYTVCRLREVGMPADYVNKLARMFQDVKVSEDLNQQFKETYRSTKGSIAGEKIIVNPLRGN